ncbi:5-oxoprolinase subunit PxpA [Flavobacteriaceae bacterium M23B6Z8]
MIQKESIDINCDVGEGLDNESSILPLISRCNIACGGHAGNEDTILKVMELAKVHQVAVGAHPSYPDQTNFGREVMKIGTRALRASLIAQLKLFKKCAKARSLNVTHIKPHGALYNQAQTNKKIALTIVKASLMVFPEAVLLAPFNSELSKVALAYGTRVMYEAFGDRSYNEDLTLVSRKESNAIIHDPVLVLKHIIQMVKLQTVRSVSGKNITIRADTFCIHGDNPDVEKILNFINQGLIDQGWAISKWNIK